MGGRRQRGDGTFAAAPMGPSRDRRNVEETCLKLLLTFTDPDGLHLVFHKQQHHFHAANVTLTEFHAIK